MVNWAAVKEEQIKQVPLFAGVDEDKLLNILSNCKVQKFGTGEYICKEGEYDENCYIILSGGASVQIHKAGGSKLERIARPRGEIFGEIAALSGTPRTADIIADRQSALLSIPKITLLALIDSFPKVKKKLDTLYINRVLATNFTTIPIFAGMAKDLLAKLKKKITLESFDAGEVIFKQGDSADAFYLVRYGFVKILQRSETNKERVLAYLKDGNYFGEMALINNQKRMATITAMNRAELIKISKDDFQKILDANPSVKGNLKKVMKKRDERNSELGKNSTLAASMSSVVQEGLIQSKAMLIIDTSKCVQCDNCEEACAALHNGQSRLTRKGSKFNDFLLIPTSCRHCEDPICMSKCPTGAITRDYTGEIYHKDFCIGCGGCASLCPYGNITMVNLTDSGEEEKLEKENIFAGLLNLVKKGNRSNGTAKQVAIEEEPKKIAKRRATKCDMCRDYSFMGCVYNCPQGAARRVDPTEFFVNIKPIG